jgi:hypothetical protein
MAASLQTRKLVQLMNEWKACLPLKPDDEQRLWKKLRLDWNYHSNHIDSAAGDIDGNLALRTETATEKTAAAFRETL